MKELDRLYFYRSLGFVSYGVVKSNHTPVVFRLRRSLEHSLDNNVPGVVDHEAPEIEDSRRRHLVREVSEVEVLELRVQPNLFVRKHLCNGHLLGLGDVKGSGLKHQLVSDVPGQDSLVELETLSLGVLLF